ncbi:ATP-dependent DNA ligase [Patescibacteria group bacterium]|nr:ATP-dependent DNA ligase [Patescibacteria group bacterium]MCL5091382.1 ATP-dependent DNA ligase [Patescibacteria group bacterium]
MKFSQLALYIKQIETTRSRLEITRLLAELFGRLSAAEIEQVVYLLQGRVAPQYVKLDFGMAEKSVVKTIAATLRLEPRLFHDQYRRLGDLGEAVQYFKERSMSLEANDRSVGAVFLALKQLAQIEGDGAQKYKQAQLAQLVQELDPLSCRYLVRIPLGVLRLGFSDMTVLDAFSWMLTGDKSLRPPIEKVYHVRPDLGLLGKELKENGRAILGKIGPRLFTPIIMMRAERLSSGKEIIEQIGRCAIEPKYDGFRLQIHYHRSSATVKIFSRNLEEVSYMFPDIMAAARQQIKADEAIIEGEAVGFDPVRQTMRPFQETVQRKRKYDVSAKAKEVPLRFFVFELLYVNGVSYLEREFSLRRKQLETVLGRTKNQVICLTDQHIETQPAAIEGRFERAIGAGLEGILAKKLDGVYQPGARGWNWIKFKRSYSAKINDTIDCLVMGYDLGKGKRTGFGIGAFLVGVYDEKRDRYLTVAKIGTGLTDDEWHQLKRRTQNVKRQDCPANYLVDKSMDCDVWLQPAIVVEIRADEITRSPVHTAELALRFPRLERFRTDKSPTDITTVGELKEMAVKAASVQTE